MLKNLKKLFVSIFTLIFSLACVVNLATYASGTWIHWNPHSEYFARSFPVLPRGAKCREDDGHDYDKYYKEDDQYGEFYRLYYDPSFSAPKKKSSTKDRECVDRLVLENLYSLSKKFEAMEIPLLSDEDPYAQYSFICQNLFKIVASEKDYIDVRNTLNGVVVKLLGVNLIKTKLDLNQKATILTIFEDLQVLGYQKYDYLNFFSKQPYLNLFDAIFVYSYICKIVGPEY